MTSGQSDAVKQQVAAHWDRRAPHFDEDFGHSIHTPAERAAWDRILDLVLAGRAGLDALDAGCGTGFLSFELTARGHQVTGVDFAPAMLVEARRKAATRGVSIRFVEADAEHLPFTPASFDLVISRHLLWTLPHPEAAIDEWIRVLRPGGRLVVVDGQFNVGASAGSRESARMSVEYAAVGDQLPFLGGRPQEEIETVLKTHGARERGRRSIARSRDGSGAADGRGRARMSYAPALRRLGRCRGHRRERHPLGAVDRFRSRVRLLLDDKVCAVRVEPVHAAPG